MCNRSQHCCSTPLGAQPACPRPPAVVHYTARSGLTNSPLLLCSFCLLVWQLGTSTTALTSFCNNNGAWHLTSLKFAAGASIAAAPLLALSLLAPDHQQSFAALLVGFALSETWRAPAAVLVRDVSPSELGATASALHLCIRNLVGGCGPLSE